MISLMDITISIFVISTAISIIMIMRVLSRLTNRLEGLSYSEIYELQQKIDRLLNELSSQRAKINILEAKLSNINNLKERIPERPPAKVEEPVMKTVEEKPTDRRPIRLGKSSLSRAEIEVLSYLIEVGESTSSEIGEKLGRSREHISRILKTLYNKGYVVRIEDTKPYRYRINEEKIDEIRQMIS